MKLSRLAHLILLLILSSTLLGTPSPVQAQKALIDLFRGDQGSEQTGAEAPTLAEKIQGLQSEAQEQLSEVRAVLQDPALAPDGALTSHYEAQASRWQELLLYYQQTLEALDKFEELKQKTQSLGNQVEDWSADSFLEQAETTFDAFNNLKDQHQIQENEIAASERALETLKTNLENYKEDYKNLESERRRAQEELENTKEDGEPLRDLKQKIALLRVESKIAEAKVLFTQQEIENENQALKLSQLRNNLLEKQLAVLKGKVEFTEEQLNAKLKGIGDERKSIAQNLERLRNQLKDIQLKIVDRKDNEGQELSPAQTAALERLQEEKQALQTKIEFLSQRFQRLDELEETWRRRYLTFNQLAENSRLVEWQDETEDLLEETRRQERLLGVRLRDLNKNLTQINGELGQNGSLGPEQRRSLQQKKASLEKLIEAHQDYLYQLFRESRLHLNLISEIEPLVSDFSIGEQASTAWNKAMKVWNYEITSIDDKPITVKKLVFVLILSFLGFRFARQLSRWVGRKLLPKFGFETGVAAGLQTLAFYILVTLVILLVLYIVNVPLTIFTVLGGALAIGVGFGSQNILRNFISGLILLAERPIKIGDLVQVDETYGTIERIGARSTLVRSFDNIHIILPNSDFLEKKVINWTLSDDIVRIAVNVGVIYGSPTRKASNLIKKAVTEHGKVLKDPEPLVLFTDFGANSLDFQVLFWIRMRTMLDRRRVESDIRYRIDSLFREAGLVIAFPQRDVHLDNIKPLEIKLLDPNQPAGSKPEKTEPSGKETSAEEPSLQERLEEHKAKKKGQEPPASASKSS